MIAAFSAGAGASAGSIGYQEELSPTLKGTPCGNMAPAVLCFSDQIRRKADGGDNSMEYPLVFENHGIDSRYTGPHWVSPTISARCGTGGNNLPLAVQEPESFCIAGNIIDREPENGGNGLGYQANVSYTLNTADRHAVFTRQRSDGFLHGNITGAQTQWQYKDTAAPGCPKNPVENRSLIRRLTPLECERLQGYPDGWTLAPGASDSVRYKALGNSVAIPCAAFVLRGVALAAEKERERGKYV